MSMLLIHEPPIQFSQSLAVEIGVNRAIVLQQLHYWLHDMTKHRYIQGTPWVNRLHNRCRSEFLMWHRPVVDKAVDSLIKTGHIITRNFKGKEELFTIDYEHIRRVNE